jgi:hypothetical protein
VRRAWKLAARAQIDSAAQKLDALLRERMQSSAP